MNYNKLKLIIIKNQKLMNKEYKKKIKDFHYN